jgi:hypothetical protein
MEYELPSSESFKYLGAIVTDRNVTNVEIKARIGAGNKCLFQLNVCLLHFRMMTRNVANCLENQFNTHCTRSTLGSRPDQATSQIFLSTGCLGL